MFLAASGTNGTVAVWNTQTHALVKSISLRSCFPPTWPIKTASALSFDGIQDKLAVAAHTNVLIVRYNVNSNSSEERSNGSEGNSEVSNREGRTKIKCGALVSDVCLNVDGSKVAVCKLGVNEISIFDANNRHLLVELTGHTSHPSHFLFGPDDKGYSVAGDQTIRIWDIPTGNETKTIRTDFVHLFNSLGLSAESDKLISVIGNVAYLWDITTGTGVQIFAQESKRARRPIELCPGGKMIALSPIGIMVMNEADNTAYIVPADPITSSRPYFESTCLHYCASESHLAIGFKDGTLGLYDVITGQETVNLKLPGDACDIRGICFSAEVTVLL
jgi:WD40 repeat protein